MFFYFCDFFYAIATEVNGEHFANISYLKTNFIVEPINSTYEIIKLIIDICVHLMYIPFQNFELTDLWQFDIFTNCYLTYNSLNNHCFPIVFFEKCVWFIICNTNTYYITIDKLCHFFFIK